MSNKSQAMASPFTTCFRSRFSQLLLIGAMLALTACGPKDFQDSEGGSGQFADFRGKWLVINYWATWCKPCREEIPELNDFARNNSDSVQLFGVNYDGLMDSELAAAINEFDMQFRNLLQDPADKLGYSRPSVLPTTIIIDPKGNIHRNLKGPQNRNSLEQIIHQADRQ